MDEPTRIRADELLPGDVISGLGLEFEVVSKTADVAGSPDEMDIYLRNGGLPLRFARIAGVQTDSAFDTLKLRVLVVALM